jgi:hypothetical protein
VHVQLCLGDVPNECVPVRVGHVRMVAHRSPGRSGSMVPPAL